MEMKDFFQLKSMGFYVMGNIWMVFQYQKVKSNKLLEEVLWN